MTTSSKTSRVVLSAAALIVILGLAWWLMPHKMHRQSTKKARHYH